MDIFGSLFPRTGRNFVDAMTQQRMAEESAARQQAAYIQNMPQGTGALTNVEPSRAGTIGNYLFGSLSGMGMPTRLANDYAGYGQTAADMTLPGTLDQLDKGDLEGAAMSIVGGPAAKGAGTFYDEISKIKLSRPLEEMTASYRDIPGALLPRKDISPEALLGSILTPAVGDRTMAGKALTGINGVPFENEVLLQGGPNFMRGPQQQADQAAWASGKGIISNISNRIKRLGAEGDPVNFVYSPMAARSSDFADMTTKAIREQLKTSKLSDAAKAKFDDAMRNRKTKDLPAFPNFPGIDNMTDEWMAKAGGQRTKIAKLMDTAEFRDLGFPDIGSTRFALTEPELLSKPSGMAGMNISRVGGNIITDPSVPHSTYDTQLGGEYIGSLPPIPRDVMFPEWMKTRKAGENLSQQDRAFGMQTVRQKADPQWLEGIMKYLQSKEGVKLGIGGAISAGLLTEQEALDLFGDRQGQPEG